MNKRVVYVLFGNYNPGVGNAVHPRDLDTKLDGEKRRGKRLTLGELEALACFGTARLLTFNNARVAGHEAFGAESLLVVGVNLDKGAGDSQTQSFGLTFVTATVEVGFDVEVAFDAESFQRLEHDVLQNRRGEILVESAVVDGDFAVAFQGQTV